MAGVAAGFAVATTRNGDGFEAGVDVASDRVGVAAFDATAFTGVVECAAIAVAGDAGFAVTRVACATTGVTCAERFAFIAGFGVTVATRFADGATVVATCDAGVTGFAVAGFTALAVAGVPDDELGEVVAFADGTT